MNDSTSGKDPFVQVFLQPIVKTGRWTLLLAAPLSLLPAIYLWVAHGICPPVQAILTGWFMIATIYGVEYFMTPISYYPILGVSGTYMAFLSGNIANVRVPCAIVAQEAVGVKAGTREGDIIATLGMAGSIITGLIVTTVAAFAGKQILDALPVIFSPTTADRILASFDYVLPAIFGGLFAIFAEKYPKFAIFGACIASFLILVIGGLPTWVVVPICSFSTIAFAIYTTKRDHKKNISKTAS